MRLPGTKTTAVRVAQAIRDWVRSAPGTYIWWLILLVTTFIYDSLPEDARDVFLRQRSTNIEHLNSDPVHVLVGSALWTSGGGLLHYAIMFTVFHATAERWLGTWRWLGVVAIGHVGATYLSQGLVLLGIKSGVLSSDMRDVVDVGVSYGLKAVMAVLVWYLARPWRWWYLAGVLISVVIPLLDGASFTDIGHFTSVLLGLACYPLTRGKGTWDPMAWWRRPKSIVPSTSAAAAREDRLVRLAGQALHRHVTKGVGRCTRLFPDRARRSGRGGWGAAAGSGPPTAC